MSGDDQDVFDLFAEDSYRPSDTPMPWYPGAKLDLDDYSRYLARLLPCGRGHAIEGARLASKIGFPWEKTEYPLRHLVRRLVLERGWPVGMVPMGRTVGFYLIDSEADAELFEKQTETRLNAIAEHRDAVLDGWARRKRSKDTGHDWPK